MYICIYIHIHLYQGLSLSSGNPLPPPFFSICGFSNNNISCKNNISYIIHIHHHICFEYSKHLVHDAEPFLSGLAFDKDSSLALNHIITSKNLYLFTISFLFLIKLFFLPLLELVFFLLLNDFLFFKSLEIGMWNCNALSHYETPLLHGKVNCVSSLLDKLDILISQKTAVITF